MPSPADLMKLMSFKNRFESSHPKFVAFVKALSKNGVEEGAVIEVCVKRPDGTELAANLKVTADDVAMVNELKNFRS